MRKSSRVLGFAILFLFLLTLGIWYAVYREDRRGMLTVSFLDIGQGDAIFIDSPSGNQVLIDGGQSSAVLRALAEVMPWWDRSIDMVIGTHPDADHIGGLLDVFPRYRTAIIMQSSVLGQTGIWRTFEKDIEKEGAQIITAERGEVVDLGDGAYLQILSPDRAVPGLETNTGCVVARLVYGKTSFMLPCDAPSSIERYLVELDAAGLHSDVLKAGHHGSKNSSSPLFVGFVDPAYAVYSRGCDNTYGHPNKETIDTFARFNIPTFDTCTEGTITFVSNGTAITKR